MRFAYNPAVRQIIAESAEMKDALIDAAEKIRGVVEVAHRMRSTPGRYGDLVIRDDEPGKVTLAATGPLAHIEEWGSINSPAYASMRRAVIATGHRFHERPR